MNSTNEKSGLGEIATLFLKLGCISFGGPAVHIAMLEDEVVHKRKWMSDQHFLDLVGATNIIPGPNSTEMTMHVGYERAGKPGLFVAGFCFIFPAVLITGIVAFFYAKYGNLPSVQEFIFGIKPAVISIIAVAAYRLGKKALKNVTLLVFGIFALVLSLLNVSEIFVLFFIGLLGLFWFYLNRNTLNTPKKLKLSFLPSIVLLGNGLGKLKIFLSFLKIGAILYGGGYVLFAFLDAEFVSRGLMTRAQLIDSVAVGQFTPGPVLSTATFVGWQLGGFFGSMLATLGIFLPSFIFVLLLNPFIPKIRKSAALSAILDTVNITAVALIVAVSFKMSTEVLLDWRSILICAISLIIVFVFKKLNSAFIVLGGSLLGYLLLFV